jgi:hypothetical protein
MPELRRGAVDHARHQGPGARTGRPMQVAQRIHARSTGSVGPCVLHRSPDVPRAPRWVHQTTPSLRLTSSTAVRPGGDRAWPPSRVPVPRPDRTARERAEVRELSRSGRGSRIPPGAAPRGSPAEVAAVRDVDGRRGLPDHAAIAGYLHAAIKPLRRPLLSPGWGRRAFYAAAGLGVGVAGVLPSTVSLALGTGAATAVAVESGVWRRGTLWRDALAGRESAGVVPRDWLGSAYSAAPERGLTVAAVAPSPTLRRSAARDRADHSSRFGGVLDEEALRVGVLAAVADIRARGGSIHEVDAVRRDARSALVQLNAVHAVETLHRPAPQAPSSRPAAAVPPPQRGPTRVSHHDAPRPARRPRRRAASQPDLDEETPPAPDAPLAATPATGQPPARRGAPAAAAARRVPSGEPLPVITRDGARPATDVPVRPQEAPAADGRHDPRAQPLRTRAGQPPGTAVAPAAREPARRSSPGGTRGPTPPQAEREQRDEAPVPLDADAAAERAAARVFAFLPDSAALQR